VSADAKDDGKSPPLPPGDALAGAPAKKPLAPPLPPPIGAGLPPRAMPKATVAAVPPKPAGGPPKLVAPPPARLIAPPPAAAMAAPRPAPIAPRPAEPIPAQAHPPSTPPLEIPMPVSAAELDARVSRSTMEFLFELEAPAAPTSREMDLGTMPEVEAAIAASNASDTPAITKPATIEVEARISMPELPIESMPPPAMSSDEDDIAVEIDPLASTPKAIPRITLRAQPAANTAEEQLEARRRRIIARLVTCRDVFRALGFLDIKEPDRKDVARLLMALDDALDPARKNLGIAKDPAAVLSGATKEEVDRIERLISPIEDKLLQLDDFVPDALLASRVDNAKITPKMLARYGRLLASRRIQAGPRRDRFEWIATALLSRKTKDGQRALVGAERATQTLELLIGGLPFKPKEQELGEAIVYLVDALERLATFSDQEAFFDSEFFIDVHGYKVSMRELILSPDFVYLSVAINVRLHNCVEKWIAAMERVHKSNQLTQDRSPRDQMTRRLRQAEDAVGSIFNVKPRGVAGQAARVDSKPPPPEPKKSLKPRVAKQAAKPGGADSGRVVLVILLLLVMLGGGGYLAHQQGLIKIDALTDLLK
jgi:hypothetical protein